ncbi:hypothetical protein [Pontimicrobium aquaticum]|uniref:S9 family peptidase n=1 Tax=Pontimicrobium aquaticum TaxID=2565367 RepID=A0A4U0EQD4_9FLAO|nr:hypothetical protein [Pontimicrobium aquaticum]TJY33893.1 hypothetical protein E5167_11245 [Pontimicrobium aquaticum]
MKLLSKLIFVVCFILANSAFSQVSTLNVTETSAYRDIVKSWDIKGIYTTDNSNIGVLRIGKRELIFDAFDENYSKIFTKIIKLDSKESYVDNLFYGDEIKVFTVHAPKRKERIVYCHTFNFKDNTYKKTKLLDASVEKKQPLFSGGNKRQTSFAMSPNGKYLAITTDNVKKNLNSYLIHVFDTNDLSLVFSKSYNEHKERFYEQNDIIITNNQEVFVIGKQFLKGRSEKKNGEANYDFILNKITNKNLETLKVETDKDQHIRSLKINNNKTFQLLGFYSEKRVSQIKGVCSFNIDKEDFTITSKKISPLPTSVYEDLYGYRKSKKKNKKELSNFYIDHIIDDGIGNSFIVAEEFFVTSSYVNTGMGGYSTITYHYDDILVLKLDEEANIKWGRSIYKRDGKPAYNVFFKDDKLHVLLNSGKNLLKKDDGRTKVSKGLFESSSLYDIEYSIDGNVNYNKIQDNKGKSHYLPYYGVFNDGKFIMENFARLRKKFMILE